jgi:hypothetical protein
VNLLPLVASAYETSIRVAKHAKERKRNLGRNKRSFGQLLNYFYPLEKSSCFGSP